MTVQEFMADDVLREAVLKTDRETWADIGGLEITGLARERDQGVTFGSMVADLSDEDLVNLRGELDDTWLKGDRHGEHGTVESVIVNLVQVVEAELGGRWVS